MVTAEQQHRQHKKTLIQRLIDLTAADMTKVNDLILSKAGSSVEMIPEISKHLISSGGKRLRPMMTLAAARMFGYGGAAHIDLAMAVEFMHTATLLHDDVVDESDLRRGRSTARMVWGNQASVLVGDFLLGQAFKVMVDVGSLQALDVLSSAAVVIAEGEVMQLAVAKHLETQEQDYLKVIYAKTAALFAAAVEVGPIIAGKGDEERQALRAYGANLGLAFQLVDDVLDYGGCAENLGKNIGDDFREGKITLPVILSFAQSTPAEKQFWQAAMENGQNDDQSFAHARALLQKHNSLAATMDKARDYGERARQSLKGIANTSYKQSLLDVVDFCIARIN